MPAHLPGDGEASRCDPYLCERATYLHRIVGRGRPPSNLWIRKSSNVRGSGTSAPSTVLPSRRLGQWHERTTIRKETSARGGLLTTTDDVEEGRHGSTARSPSATTSCVSPMAGAATNDTPNVALLSEHALTSAMCLFPSIGCMTFLTALRVPEPHWWRRFDEVRSAFWTWCHRGSSESHWTGRAPIWENILSGASWG